MTAIAKLQMCNFVRIFVAAGKIYSYIWVNFDTRGQAQNLKKQNISVGPEDNTRN